MWSSWPWVRTTARKLSRRASAYEKSGMTWSIPGNSSSGNMRPQSTAIKSSPDSISIMLRPISPRPPRGISRTTGSTGLLSRRRANRTTRPQIPRHFAERRAGESGGQLCEMLALRFDDQMASCGARSERSRGLEAGDELVRVAGEVAADGSRDRLAGDELLAERVHVRPVVHDAVVEVRPGR